MQGGLEIKFLEFLGLSQTICGMDKYFSRVLEQSVRLKKTNEKKEQRFGQM